MRPPKDFFRPLAAGAPEPVREIPIRPSRVIHFLPPFNTKMVAKVPDLAPTVDVLLANLEDGVPASEKENARAGLVEIGKNWQQPDTQLWTRVNALDSPWVLDDLIAAVTEVGDRVEVIMIPKVEGPEDIHYVDRLVAQLEARAGLDRPILLHAILETHTAAIVEPHRAELHRDLGRVGAVVACGTDLSTRNAVPDLLELEQIVVDRSGIGGHAELVPDLDHAQRSPRT